MEEDCPVGVCRLRQLAFTELCVLGVPKHESLTANEDFSGGLQHVELKCFLFGKSKLILASSHHISYIVLHCLNSS